MNHVVSEVHIYVTSDYSRFTAVDGNRKLNLNKIARIIDQIKSGNDILDDVPILVTKSAEKLPVLDGQHRLEICKKLKRPVHYIIRKELSILNIAKVNTNVEKWKAEDFINAYKKAGNENYSKIEKFHKTYGIAIGLSLVMLQHGLVKNDSGYLANTGEFEQGTFEVKKWKEAVQLAELCKTFNAFPQWNTRGFIYAICRILSTGKADMDVLLKKFQDDPLRLKMQPTYKHYLINLEEIYNTGFSKRRTIYE